MWSKFKQCKVISQQSVAQRSIAEFIYVKSSEAQQSYIQMKHR